MALAVEGTNVSLLVDCHLLATLPLERGPQPLVSTEGVTVFGARLPGEEVFEVGTLPGSLCRSPRPSRSIRGEGGHPLAAASCTGGAAPCAPWGVPVLPWSVPVLHGLSLSPWGFPVLHVLAPPRAFLSPWGVPVPMGCPCPRGVTPFPSLHSCPLQMSGVMGKEAALMWRGPSPCTHFVPSRGTRVPLFAHPPPCTLRPAKRVSRAAHRSVATVGPGLATSPSFRPCGQGCLWALGRGYGGVTHPLPPFSFATGRRPAAADRG